MIIMFLIEKLNSIIKYKYSTNHDDKNYGIISINTDSKEIEFEKRYDEICENLDSHAYIKAEEMLNNNKFENQITVAWY